MFCYSGPLCRYDSWILDVVWMTPPNDLMPAIYEVMPAYLVQIDQSSHLVSSLPILSAQMEDHQLPTPSSLLCLRVLVPWIPWIAQGPFRS